MNVWDKYTDPTDILDFCEGYKSFISASKTEREAVKSIRKLAEAAGFRDMQAIYQAGGRLAAGDKVYIVKNSKTVSLFVVGRKSPVDGLRLICSHLDSPRLDIRPVPVYEREDLAFLKTHYYGGIKKYQWAALPLALYGVVVKTDGTRVDIAVGDGEDDPVFYVSDLPKHVSAEQLSMTMEKGVTAEDLNVVAGSRPLKDETSKRFARALLHLLKERYSIEERDFVSAELELVPAGRARDVGFDRSLITAYAHDDKICVYPSLMSLLVLETPEYSCGAVYIDKEEVGNVGNTAMDSHYFENVIAQLLEMTGDDSYAALRKCLERSMLLSADVVLGMDPNWPRNFDDLNTARLGWGPVITKYAGRLGKNGANDANAEFLALVRNLLEAEGIAYQTGEFGRQDLGGGGTIAPYASKYGMQVVDMGVALLSMHAPFELASKADIYETCRAYGAFYRSTSTIEDYQ